MTVLTVDPINYKATSTFLGLGPDIEVSADVLLNGILTEAIIDKRSTVAFSSHYRIIFNNLDVGYFTVNRLFNTVELFTLEPQVGEVAPDRITLTVIGKKDGNPI